MKKTILERLRPASRRLVRDHLLKHRHHFHDKDFQNNVRHSLKGYKWKDKAIDSAMTEIQSIIKEPLPIKSRGR